MRNTCVKRGKRRDTEKGRGRVIYIRCEILWGHRVKFMGLRYAREKEKENVHNVTRYRPFVFRRAEAAL